MWVNVLVASFVVMVFVEEKKQVENREAMNKT